MLWFDEHTIIGPDRSKYLRRIYVTPTETYTDIGWREYLGIDANGLEQD